MSYSGWFQLDPAYDFTNTVFSLSTPAVGPPIAANNIQFSGGDVTDSVLLTTLNGDLFRLPVPNFGNFAVNSALTNTPLGSATGTGFFSANPHFFFYNLDFVNTGSFATLFGGSPFTGAFPTTGFATHSYTIGHPIPAGAGGDIMNLADFTIYSAYGANISGNITANSSPTGPTRSVAGGAVVVFDESGGTQHSAMFGLTGNYIDGFTNPTVGNTGAIELAAFGRGSTRLSPTGHGIRTIFGATSLPDSAGNSFFGASGPDFFVLNSANTSGFFSAPRSDSSVAFYQPLDAVGVGIVPFFTNGFAQPSTPPADLGALRTTHSAIADRLYGYTGGITEIRSGGVFAGDRVFNNDPDFSLTGSASSQTTLALITNAETNGAFVIIRTQDVDSAFGNQYRFGGSNGSSQAAFIDDKRIILRDRFVAAGNENNLALNAGTIGIGVLGPGGVGDPAERASLLFATSEVVGNVLPDAVTPCTCEFLRWGYWSGELRAGDATVATDPLRRESTHLATWVSGEIPTAAVVGGFTGTASYTGHIVGAVNNAGNYSVRAATFTHAYNFGSKTGTFAVAGFDGVNYSGATSSPVQANDFSATAITAAGSNRVMKLEGSFFSSPTDQVKYNGGNFSIGNPANSYKAGGIFAGQRP